MVSVDSVLKGVQAVLVVLGLVFGMMLLYAIADMNAMISDATMSLKAFNDAERARGIEDSDVQSKPVAVKVQRADDLLPPRRTRKQQARFVHFVGVTMEVFGKNASNGWYTKPFFAALQHAGVQIQVAALDDLGLISREPNKAFWQGFMVGL
jgi:hypothetical protein